MCEGQRSTVRYTQSSKLACKKITSATTLGCVASAEMVSLNPDTFGDDARSLGGTPRLTASGGSPED